MGLALTGVAVIIFGAVAGPTAGAIAGVMRSDGSNCSSGWWCRCGCVTSRHTFVMRRLSCRPGLHSGQAWEHTRHVDSQNRASLAVRSIHRPRHRDVTQPIGHPRSGAEPTVAALADLPEPYGDKIPSNPETVARINAAVQVGGGLLLATGKLPRIASAALAFTVIPGSLGGHLFWTEKDPERKVEQRRALLTDLSLLGGLIIAAADTAGKPSLGWRGQAGGRPALGGGDVGPTAGRVRRLGVRFRAGRTDRTWPPRRRRAQSRAGQCRGRDERDRGRGCAQARRELASTAAKRSEPVVEAARKRARKRGAELADTVRERGAELAETARERGSELAENARERGSESARGLSNAAASGPIRPANGLELAETARERSGELAARGRVKARRWR